MTSVKPSPPRPSMPSNPVAAELAETVTRVRSVDLPRMRDQRSVTRGILDRLRDKTIAILVPALSDSRG